MAAKRKNRPGAKPSTRSGEKKIVRPTGKGKTRNAGSNKTATSNPAGKSAIPSGKLLDQQPGWIVNSRLVGGLLFLVGALLYANTLGHSFVQDDAIVITDNMFTQQGVSGIGGIFQHDTFFGFFQEEGKAKLVSGGRYRPLSVATFALEYSLFGANPLVSHLLNALLYGFLCWLLYQTLLMLTPPRQFGTYAFWLALTGSLLFAVHPVHTEAVANIKGRDEMLALIGSIGALCFSIKGIREQQARFFWLAGGLLFLALLSKENAITYVAVIPLAAYFFTRAKAGQYLWMSIPLILAAMVFLGIRSSILGPSFGAPPMELMNNPYLKWENGRYVPFSPSERLATVTYTLGRYLQILFFPHPLTHDYYPKHIDFMQWTDWRVLLSFFAYAGLLVWGLVGLGKRDHLSFAIWAYLLPLSLVSNIVFPIGTHMAERLLFMPSVGWALGVAVLGWRLAILLNGKKELKNWSQLRVPLLILGLTALLFSIKTESRNTAWSNNFTLFSTDIATSPRSAKLRNAMGGELLTQALEEANAREQQNMRLEAVGHLQKAVELHPTYKNAWLLLGNAHNYLKQYKEAIQAYEKALELDPDYEDAFNNLLITYQEGGRDAGERLQNMGLAFQYLNTANRLRPKDYETLRLLGVAHGVQGNAEAAVKFFKQAAEARPELADAWFNLGTAYYGIGDAAQGEAYRQKAREMDPEVEKRMGGF